jgi:4-hydroxybutyrate dehydrogenase/sulfolactaldehyde 3-reductase
MVLLRIGFIGLGTMGGPMARNLLRAGFGLRVFDVEPTAVEALVSAGGSPAGSAADAARGAEAVITMLPNGEHVEAAVFGKAGAVEGKLLIMAGGAAADLDRARPLFEKLGDTIVHCGGVGSGARMKLINNFMSITLNATTAEALTLAEASGLDPELARRVMLGTPAGQGHMATTYPTKVLKNDLTPGFMVDLADKDLGLAIELAAQLNVDVPTATAAKQAYEFARREGYGRNDWTAIYSVVRRRRRGSSDSGSP